MRPPEIAAAWGRGDIDATFIWDPVLSQVKKNGKVLTTSGDICKQGACTFDGLVVRRSSHREPGIHGGASQSARQVGCRISRQSQVVDRRFGEGSGRREVVGRQARRRRGCDGAVRFPSLDEQASPAWLGGGAEGAAAKALSQQANFLKEQGRLQSVAPDFSKNVTTQWVTQAKK